MSPTILDALEEDLEASESTAPASHRAVRRLLLVSAVARDELTSHESMGPDAAIPVTNIADSDLEVMSDTATDPEVDNVEEGGDESEANSSGDDSIVGDNCGRKEKKYEKVLMMQYAMCPSFTLHYAYIA